MCTFCKLFAINAYVEEISPTAGQDHNLGGESCEYCLGTPCITSVAAEGKLGFLRAYGQPRLQNISKRYKSYREYYKMLHKAGLWNNPVYVQRKYELGLFVEDVREVMPSCVVNDVRKRWPNPAGVPYKGHVPTL